MRSECKIVTKCSFKMDHHNLKGTVACKRSFLKNRMRSTCDMNVNLDVSEAKFDSMTEMHTIGLIIGLNVSV